LYVPRVITRFQEAKTLVVLPFIIPPSERTMGWKGRLLVGRWRTLWSATESRYFLTNRDGLLSFSGRLVVRESLVARETTVRSCSALASPVAWDPSRVIVWMSLRLLVWWPRVSIPSSPSTPQRPYLRSLDTQSAPGSPYRRRQRLLPEETSTSTGADPNSEGDPWGNEEAPPGTPSDRHVSGVDIGIDQKAVEVRV
jgi:hypothetical protein